MCLTHTRERVVHDLGREQKISERARDSNSATNVHFLPPQDISVSAF